MLKKGNVNLKARVYFYRLVDKKMDIPEIPKEELYTAG